MEKTEAVIQEILLERRRQDQKWGEQNHTTFKWLAILGEEFGEACTAALEYSNLREELIQVAAVAVVFIECLDRQGKQT